MMNILMQYEQKQFLILCNLQSLLSSGMLTLLSPAYMY